MVLSWAETVSRVANIPCCCHVLFLKFPGQSHLMFFFSCFWWSFCLNGVSHISNIRQLCLSLSYSILWSLFLLSGSTDCGNVINTFLIWIYVLVWGTWNVARGVQGCREHCRGSWEDNSIASGSPSHVWTFPTSSLVFICFPFFSTFLQCCTIQLFVSLDMLIFRKLEATRKNGNGKCRSPLLMRLSLTEAVWRKVLAKCSKSCPLLNISCWNFVII